MTGVAWMVGVEAELTRPGQINRVASSTRCRGSLSGTSPPGPLDPTGPKIRNRIGHGPGLAEHLHPRIHCAPSILAAP
jgi:hypothetical protein